MTPTAPWQQAFRHSTPIEIRYADIDMMRHVNNVTYFTYLEQARVAYAREVMGWDGQWDTLNIIVANHQFDYLLPVFLFDKIEVRTRTLRMGTKSMVLEYVVVRTQPDGTLQLCGKGSTALVAYDMATGQSMAIPASWRQAISSYEPQLPEGL